jgi:kynureninase
MSPMERSEALDARDPLAAVRQRFVLPSGVVYLDGNSLGALPVGVAARVAAVVREQWGEGLIRSWNDADWYNLPTSVGDRIAPLVGARPGEIVVGDSTSVSLFRVVSAALSLRPDRHIIVTEEGNFPTDLYILEGIKQLRPNLEIRAIERDVDPASALEGAAALVLTHVDYKTGLVRDMKRLSTAAHQAGALAVWDLSHSTGAVELDLHGGGADFAVGCGYKYLNGGPGAPSFTWAAPAVVADARQPLSGWFGHRDPFAFDVAYAPAPGIRRFITGTQQVLSLVALDEALKIWEGVSMREVREKSIAQTSRFLERVEAGVAEAGAEASELRCVSPREATVRGGHVSFAHPNGYAIVQALIAAGIIGDFRAPDLMRFGFSPLYLSFAEIDRAADALVQILVTRSWDQPRFTARRTVT